MMVARLRAHYHLYKLSFDSNKALYGIIEKTQDLAQEMEMRDSHRWLVIKNMRERIIMPLATAAANLRVAELLREQQIIPAGILESLLLTAKKRQAWIGCIAMEEGLLSHDELADVLARAAKLPKVNVRTYSPDARALELLPVEDARMHGVLPLTLQRGKLVLAMTNPLDELSKDVITRVVRCELVIYVAPFEAIVDTQEEWYSNASSQRAPGSSRDLPQLTSDAQFPGSATPPNREFPHPSEQMCLEDLLMKMMERRASDMHLATGSAPLIRVDGLLQTMPYPVLMPHAIQSIMYAILTDVQITNFERHWELDFSYSIPGVSRFRVNLHRQRGSIGAVFRTIPMEVPSLEKLRMPRVVREFTRRPRGLVLVTGPTGSGKSTTLAAMIDEINRTRPLHIVTIEDPIEFLHTNKMSVVTQREVGADTESFASALRHVLRQDPDVILIGEMRDLETISAALTAAETGHLVLGHAAYDQCGANDRSHHGCVSGRAAGTNPQPAGQYAGRDRHADAAAAQRCEWARAVHRRSWSPPRPSASSFAIIRCTRCRASSRPVENTACKPWIPPCAFSSPQARSHWKKPCGKPQIRMISNRSWPYAPLATSVKNTA